MDRDPETRRSMHDSFRPNGAVVAVAVLPSFMSHARRVVQVADAPSRPRASFRRQRLTPQARQASSDVAVLAGGCFWGVQGVFQHVTGCDQRRLGLRRRR